MRKRDSKGRFIKGVIPWNKGIKGIHLSPKTEFKKGKTYTEEEKNKRSKIAKERGIGKWMKGRTPAFIRQDKHCHPKGENHPNWKGGKWVIRSSDEYKEWRKKVFKRDHFTCQKCGHRFLNIVAHHIKSFADYTKLRFDIDNGITLCRSCHIKIHCPHKSIKDFK